MGEAINSGLGRVGGLDLTVILVLLCSVREMGVFAHARARTLTEYTKRRIVDHIKVRESNSFSQFVAIEIPFANDTSVAKAFSKAFSKGL